MMHINRSICIWSISRESLFRQVQATVVNNITGKIKVSSHKKPSIVEPKTSFPKSKKIEKTTNRYDRRRRIFISTSLIRFGSTTNIFLMHQKKTCFHCYDDVYLAIHDPEKP
ncbi:CLUMA_CG003215, isoform A [Clunio marinus]|uniref:CLUMA_CG003215, isoform A n=1 Tax=Clunio marinus TaxID=568069 RepID=A0A1J1HN48_9DIPT|nr:CLUMA_CG003215, isoform A [Clunio marinus]